MASSSSGRGKKTKRVDQKLDYFPPLIDRTDVLQEDSEEAEYDLSLSGKPGYKKVPEESTRTKETITAILNKLSSMEGRLIKLENNILEVNKNVVAIRQALPHILSSSDDYRFQVSTQQTSDFH